MVAGGIAGWKFNRRPGQRINRLPMVVIGIHQIDMAQAVETDVADQAAHLAGCYRCGRPLRRGWGFVFKIDPGSSIREAGISPTQIFKCVLCALRHIPMLRRSRMVAVVVGKILTLLNQGDTLLAGNWKTALYWKIPLTYCVPFCVATFGALTNSRHRLQPGASARK